MGHTWYLPVVRSLLLRMLWYLNGQSWPGWVNLVPWGLWQAGGMLWPWLGRQPEWRGLGWFLWQAQRGLLVASLGLTLGRLWGFSPSVLGAETWGRLWAELQGEGLHFLLLSLGCVVCHREEPWVEVVPGEDGGYIATLCGHFTLQVAAEDPFRMRTLMLFLRLLEVPGVQRRRRRTRDGRAPFVSQEQLAAWFQMPQPDISRIERYWQEGDWANLLSLKTPEVLTPELRGRIVEVFATFPWWGMEKIYRHLREQGVAVSLRQVRQAAEESGWSQLHQALVKRYHLTAESIRPRDHWPVEQLLTLVESLLTKVEAGEGLTAVHLLALQMYAWGYSTYRRTGSALGIANMTVYR